MSARDDLFINMGEYLTTDEASQLIDAFAHELAEKIRNHPDHDDAWGKGFYSVLGLGMAADMIDPEVNNG